MDKNDSDEIFICRDVSETIDERYTNILDGSFAPRQTKNIQNVLHRMITDRLNLVNDVNPVTIIRSTSIANDK
jgi:hypothetical protein